MAVTGAIFPKRYSNAVTRHEQKKKHCPIQHLSVINEFSKALRQKLAEWIMKNSNVCESPIERDFLLIKYAESRVKWRVPKSLNC